MAITWFRFSAELPAGRQLLPGAGMDSLHQTPLGFSSDQGEKFVLSAALYSCHYPGDEKVQLYLLWRNFGCSQPNSLSVLKVFFWSTFKWWGYCGKGEGINDFSSVFWLPPACHSLAHRSWVSTGSDKKGTFSFALWLWRFKCSYLWSIHKWSIYLKASSYHSGFGKHITADTQVVLSSVSMWFASWAQKWERVRGGNHMF